MFIVKKILENVEMHTTQRSNKDLRIYSFSAVLYKAEW